MRSGEPAKLTATPRSRSASATASAGSTCPAVPPAAIRHLNSRRSCMTTRDVKEDPDRQELDHEARAAVRDERKRDPGQRSHPDHGGDVDRRLDADERRVPSCETLHELI